ncbi:catalase [Striga asiatica]|uniref:Catalase n=1 Tax=Striga asiatica TaxID=4170 RepID=A0A5A7Q0K9_STRAF|nr:catalase [Striga asiatica]
MPSPHYPIFPTNQREARKRARLEPNSSSSSRQKRPQPRLGSHSDQEPPLLYCTHEVRHAALIDHFAEQLVGCRQVSRLPEAVYYHAVSESVGRKPDFLHSVI